MRVRGWNPDIFAPMRAGDGWLIRVKPPGQRLATADAEMLAGFAERHGNGVIEITSRGNVQLRGVDLAYLGELTPALRAAGLISQDPALERRRNILVSPLSGDDPAISGDPLGIAAAIGAGLADAGFAALPGRWRFVIDGGGVVPLADMRADLRVEIRPHACAVITGEGVRHVCAESEAAGLALALAAASCCRALLPALAPLPPEAGFLAYPGGARGAFAAAPAFGQMDAAMLTTLSCLATRFGDGLIRLSPHRAALIGGVAAGVAPALDTALREAGFITDPADPRLGIIACIGAPACAGADAPSRADAARLAALLGAPLRPGARPIHVSGCAKGCAHPGRAPAVLVGVGKNPDGGSYDLAFDATTDRVGQQADHRLLSIAEAAVLLDRGAAEQRR